MSTSTATSILHSRIRTTGQLRQDLPGIVHRLSQQWVKAKVEALYLDKRPPPVVRRPFDTASLPDQSHLSDGPFGPGCAVAGYTLWTCSLRFWSFCRKFCSENIEKRSIYPNYPTLTEPTPA